jgi:hypothetical protein
MGCFLTCFITAEGKGFGKCSAIWHKRTPLIFWKNYLCLCLHDWHCWMCKMFLCQLAAEFNFCFPTIRAVGITNCHELCVLLKRVFHSFLSGGHQLNEQVEEHGTFDTLLQVSDSQLFLWLDLSCSQVMARKLEHEQSSKIALCRSTHASREFRR